LFIIHHFAYIMLLTGYL